MKNGLFHRRIPTLLALGILCVVIVISTLLIQSGVFYVGKAAPEAAPQNVVITNISDTSFAVVFTTPVTATGIVNMTEGSGASLVLDDRDKRTGQAESYFSHHVTVPNLKPNTVYTFDLLVNGKKFKNTSYKAKTGSPIESSPPEQNPLFGQVLLPAGGNATDTLIVAATKDGQTVSDITSEKGAFIIPTNSWRNTDLSEYLIFEAATPFTITAFRESMKAEVTTTFEVAQNLPAITLLETYSFLKTSEEVATGSPGLVIPQSGGARRIDIVIPENGQSFIDSQPLFSGTAYPNRTVTVTILGLGTFGASSNLGGSWSYRPEQDLSQGEHTIIIESTDDTGRKITDSAIFSVFPSGSQVAQTATPSATPILTPTATPTSIPTPTPTTAMTTPAPTTAPLTPTAMPTPTVVISQVPTTIPATTITPTPTQPIVGGFGNSVVLTGLSLVLVIAGALLLVAL